MYGLGVLSLSVCFLVCVLCHSLFIFLGFVLCFLHRYIPPLLWGKSGHLQTALYGKMGRVSAPTPFGVRKYLPMQDGATATFDLFEPQGDHQTGGEIRFYFVLDIVGNNRHSTSLFRMF